MYMVAEILLSGIACYGVHHFFRWLHEENDKINRGGDIS